MLGDSKTTILTYLISSDYFEQADSKRRNPRFGVMAENSYSFDSEEASLKGRRPRAWSSWYSMDNTGFGGSKAKAVNSLGKLIVDGVGMGLSSACSRLAWLILSSRGSLVELAVWN